MKKIDTCIFNIICYVLIGISLTACGFHLRGHAPENADSKLISLNIRGINRYDDIADSVKQLAKSRDIKLAPNAEWSISLGNEELERWQASTTQSTTTSEYLLRLHVTLHIHHKDINYRPMELSRQAIFQNNADESSSKSNEQEIILAELRYQLAEDILQRLQIISNNPPDCDCDESEPATTE